MNDSIRDLVLAHKPASTLRDAAIASGMTTIQESAKARVLDGTTSVGYRIQLDHLQFHDIADVLAHAGQVGTSVVITLDADDSITLANTSLAGMRAGDFLFA